MSREQEGIKEEEVRGQTLLGIDYGEKFIGLSLFTVGRDPFPFLHGRIVASQVADPKEEIKKIVEEEAVDIIILGLPHLTDGTESTMTLKVKKFGESLSAYLENMPLYFQDETLSTYEAQERMKSDPRFDFKVDLQKIDALSAAIIIEQFLQEQVIK